MQKRLLDILADPDDPDIWPLKLKIFKSENRKREQIPSMHEASNRFCKFYCYVKDSYLVSNPLGDDETQLDQSEIDKIVSKEECLSCFEEEITAGIIYHEKDKSLKWFIIDEEIAVMFPVNLRDKNQEKQFIKKYTDDCQDMGIIEPFYTDD